MAEAYGEKIKIPVGISDFRKIREEGYYYVDKSRLIQRLFQTDPVEVMLFTRPRRFGKTLAMNMLAHFLDVREDSQNLFKGLEIAEYTEICEAWQNCYPTVFLTLKDVDGLDFEAAKGMLRNRIANLYNDHIYLQTSGRVNQNDRKVFRELADTVDGSPTDDQLKTSLFLLMKMMGDHYGKQVILLLDEYDVPLAKASSAGYYEQMLELLRTMFGTALKDNRFLKCAVITGCLKIAKESIFTGTNNFVSDSVSSTRFEEFFGFTQEDVRRLLADAGLEKHAGRMKEWYDGYHFGDADVYCPWDVMNYVYDLQMNEGAIPVGYWKNTSDNAVIRSFIDYSGSGITRKLETLMAGGSISERIEENLTYDYLHSSEENLWSVLYLTGYLTAKKGMEKEEAGCEGKTALVIPNEEIREIFETTVRKWFDDSAKQWDRKPLFTAVWNGSSERITEEMNRLLRRTISYHDYREDFYHAFLAGIFTGAGYVVESNREHGEGRSDVVVYDPSGGRAAVFEVKYASDSAGLEKGCEKALRQIGEKKYAEELLDEYDGIVCYGIAFYKKKCLVKKMDE